MLNSFRFFAAMRRNFRTVGAIAPSSQHLAKTMVRHLGPIDPEQVIIELGPGTGPITRGIRRAYPDNPLLAIEFDQTMADRLQRRFPDVNVVCGCATKLVEHLHHPSLIGKRVAGVISGLPVLNFPSDLRDQVFGAVAEVLPAGRPYVQFTYSKHRWRHIKPPGFALDGARRVLINVPPAVVLPFIREVDAGALEHSA